MTYTNYSKNYVPPASYPPNAPLAAEYDRLDFLLSQVATPAWQAALEPDLKENLLRPYRVARHEAGLRLGRYAPLPDHLRQVKISAVRLLLTDLQNPSLEGIDARNLGRLTDYVLTKGDLIEAEFRTYPSFSNIQSYPELNARTQLEVLASVLNLLTIIEGAPVVDNPAVLSPLVELYQDRLAALQKVETARQQAEQRRQPAQVPQIRWPQAQAQPAVPADRPSSPPVAQPVAPAPALKPEKPKFKWENVWSALLSEVTLRTLLYLGALLVVAAAAVFITLNWNQFPPFIQVSMLMGVDLLFYAGGYAVLKVMKLPWAGITFIAIGAAILPFCLYGYTRPGLLNLNGQQAWLAVSLAALACYLPVSWWLREKIFGYMTSLAALNACWTVLYQFQISPEWLAAASLLFAAGLVWVSGRLQQRPALAELAAPPLWVGQLTVVAATLGLFSYSLYAAYAGISFASLEYAMGASWVLAAAFYVWCARRDPAHRVSYTYGASLAGLVAACLLLHKLPYISNLYGLALWLMGTGYVLAEALPKLVERLNDHPDGTNLTAWPFREVFNLKQPLTNFGWTLVLVSPLLAGSPLSLAGYLGLVAVFLLGATLLYNWSLLAYGALLAGAAAFYSLLAPNLTQPPAWPWLVLLPATVFSLWQLAATLNGPRWHLFKRPLELGGHAAAVLALLATGGGYLYTLRLNGYKYGLANPALALNLLLVAALYALVAWGYRARPALDLGLLLAVAATGLAFPAHFNLALALAGFGLAAAGYGLREIGGPILRRVYGQPLQQWGYGLATFGTFEAFFNPNAAFSTRGQLNAAVVAGSLYILLAVVAAWATPAGWLAWWPRMFRSLVAKVSDKQAGSYWLYPALGLVPCLVWQLWPVEWTVFGRGLAAIAVAYFILAMVIRFLIKWPPVENRADDAGVIYSLPAFVAWAASGGAALVMVYREPLAVVLVGTALALTGAVATYALKRWTLNYAVAGLVCGVFMQAMLLMKPSYELSQLTGALFVVALMGTGYGLESRYGRPFRQAAHLLALMVVGAFLVNAPFSRTAYNPSGGPALGGLIISALYAGLALRERKAQFYAAFGLVATATNLVLAAWFSRLTGWPFGWPLEAGLAAGFLWLAWLAAGWHLAAPSKDLSTFKLDLGYKGVPPLKIENTLVGLSHLWAGLAFGVALSGGWSLVCLVGLGLILLYVVRSRLERKPWLLAVPALLGFWLTLAAYRWAGQDIRQAGLALVALSALYLALARRFTGSPVAARIFGYGGKALLVVAVALAAPDEPLLVATLLAIALLAAWQAWREKTEWSYLVAASGLSAYILGFDLLNPGWQWLGLALFAPAAVLLAAGLLLQTSQATAYARVGRSLVIGAGCLTAMGLAFSWLSAPVLLVHSLVLVGLSLLMLLRSDKRVGWFWALLAAGHLAYIAGLATVVNDLAGANQAQAGLALLPLGLVLSVVAMWSGPGLRQLAAKPAGAPRRLALYLAAGIDLALSLPLTLHDHQIGLVVAAVLGGWLVVMALRERLEPLAWLAYLPAGIASWHSGAVSAIDPALAAIYTALGGFGLLALSYLAGWERTRVLVRPARFGGGNLLVVAVVVLTFLLVGRGDWPGSWGYLSWLLSIIGLSLLLVSLFEQRRRPNPTVWLRYLSYGSIALLEVAFVLWLLLEGKTQLQIYTLPVGLLCLAFGWSERWHTNRPVAGLLEGLGLLILLGTTLLQALNWQTGGLDKVWFGTLLLAESALAVGFGAANRLRYYFFGGIAGTLLALVALLIDPVAAADRWLTIGGTGLVLIGVALLLERKREQIRRTAGEWLHQLEQWQ